MLYLILWLNYFSSSTETDINGVIYIQSNNNHSKIKTKHEQIISNLINALQPTNRNITLLITSCGRLDLLNETISSFLHFYPHQKYPLHEKIIIDDSRNINISQQLIASYFPEFQIILTSDNEYEQKFKHRDERITNAMDKIFKQVTTEWIYKLEDDWKFLRGDFVDESFDIFETSLPHKYKSNKLTNTYPANYRNADKNRSAMDHYFYNSAAIYSVVLCWNMYRQRIWVNRTYLYEYKESKWYDMKYHLKRNVLWGGYSFNAGLQPTFLYKMYGNFLSPKGEGGRSEMMIRDGFKVALMAPPACDHIGRDRHVTILE